MFLGRSGSKEPSGDTVQQSLLVNAAVWSHAAESRGSFQWKRGKAWHLRAVREMLAGVHERRPTLSPLAELDLHFIKSLASSGS